MRKCVVSRISIGLKICCIGNGGTAGEFVCVSQNIHQVIIHQIFAQLQSGEEVARIFRGVAVGPLRLGACGRRWASCAREVGRG
jgi:hypothetical protein